MRQNARLQARRRTIDVAPLKKRSEPRRPGSPPGRSARHRRGFRQGRGGQEHGVVQPRRRARPSWLQSGLVDADIHGPSVPTMFDVAGEKPQPVEVEGKTEIEPIKQYGVKVLSIGFFADPDQAIVWRGPMASRALNQLFTDAEWGALDFMIVDLPPGTGDIHLSLVQQIPLSGAVIVSTPQDVALADARKGVGMFRLDELKVPVLGLVENMAYFVPPDAPDKRYHIFGRDGVKRLADSLEAPFLGELPLLQTIREAGDTGRPAVMQSSGEAAAAFRAVVANLLKQLGKDV